MIASVCGMLSGLLEGNLPLMLSHLMNLILFGIGVLLGIYIVAKLISFLLRRWPTHTYCAVLGLVAASPIALLLRTDMSGVSVTTILVSIATFAVGFALSAWLSAKGEGDAAPAKAQAAQASCAPATPIIDREKDNRG